MQDTVVGIDLGTTSSLIGALVDGTPALFSGAQSDELLPSIVSAGEDGATWVGRAAQNRRLLDPDGTVVEVKRKMGSTAELRVGHRRLSPQEVSALILGALLDRAEQALGERPRRAIITVPAQFDDAQRQATRDAGAIAGLTVERLVNEPTAAAVTYQTGAEELVLVYDLGGGTFDVSLLDRDEGLLEVRCSRGDTQLGGGDIDRALASAVLERLGDAGDRVKRDPHALTRLYDAVERAKIALSDRTRVRLFEPFLTGGDDPVNLDLTLERAEVERVARPFVERTLACIDAALRDAGVQPRDLHRVLLVGGASKMPCVRELVTEHLGRPVIVDENADRAVALGATLLAGRAAGLDVDEVLLDVAPHTLAVGAVGGVGASGEELIAVSIIARDTVVPVEQAHTFYTRFKDQPAVFVPIVQGEHPLVAGNTALGEVCIEDLPPGPERSPVEIQFRLDLSGVLDVSATHTSSGRSARVTIANSPYRLSELRRESARKQVEALRAAGPSGDATAEIDPTLARALMARASRALEGDRDDEAARHVRDALGALETALASSAPDLSALSDALSDALLDLA